MTEPKKATISATEARVRFGEILRRAETGETLIVERGGHPKAVILGIDEYSRLREPDHAEELLQDRLHRVRQRYLREANDVHWDVEGDIRQMREERADELDSSLR